jgi:hypothetical protein
VFRRVDIIDDNDWDILDEEIGEDEPTLSRYECYRCDHIYKSTNIIDVIEEMIYEEEYKDKLRSVVKGYKYQYQGVVYTPEQLAEAQNIDLDLFLKRMRSGTFNVEEAVLMGQEKRMYGPKEEKS